MAYAVALQSLLNSPCGIALFLRVVRFTSPVLSVAVSAASWLTSTPTLMAFNNNNKEDFYSAHLPLKVGAQKYVDFRTFPSIFAFFVLFCFSSFLFCFLAETEF